MDTRATIEEIEAEKTRLYVEVLKSIAGAKTHHVKADLVDLAREVLRVKDMRKRTAGKFDHLRSTP